MLSFLRRIVARERVVLLSLGLLSLIFAVTPRGQYFGLVFAMSAVVVVIAACRIYRDAMDTNGRHLRAGDKVGTSSFVAVRAVRLASGRLTNGYLTATAAGLTHTPTGSNLRLGATEWFLPVSEIVSLSLAHRGEDVLFSFFGLRPIVKIITRDGQIERFGLSRPRRDLPKITASIRGTT